MDQQFTVTVTAYCLSLKIHIRNVTILKIYIVNCTVILNTVCAVSHLMSLVFMDKIIIMVKL